MRRRRLGSGFIAIFWLATAALAHEPTAPQVDPVETRLAVAAERANPRATMATFFRAFRRARQGAPGDPIQQAVESLDLSMLPLAARQAKGRELAVLLKDVLDKTERIDVDAIPDDPDGPPHVVVSRPEGEVLLVRQQDGEWRFSAETVARLAEMAEALADVAVVQGVEVAVRSISPALWLRSLMPTTLKKSAFLLENWQWLGILILVVLGLAFDRLATALAARLWAAFFRRRTPEDLDRDVAKATARPIGIIVMAVTWSLGLPWLGLPPQALGIFSVVITFLITAGSVWAAYRGVDVLAALLEARARRSESKFDDLLVPLARKTLKIFIAAFGLVFVAENLDVDMTGLLAGIGIGGLALALAAKDAVKNVFGSLMVILDRPFEVGDAIVAAGVEGTVEELGFRSTRVRTFENSLVTLPNANLIDAVVDNRGKRNFRRWKTTFGLTYDTSPEKIEAFCEGVRELIKHHPHTRKQGFEVRFHEFGPVSLDVLMSMFFETREWSVELASRHRLGIDILRLAERLGVEFAFPTQTIHLLQGAGGEAEASADSTAYSARLRAAEEAARRHAEKLSSDV